MFDRLRDNIISIFTSRLTLLVIIFGFLGGMLAYRLFDLQIVNGQAYLDKFILQTEKTRDISSSRGTIRDCNGNVLAYDELAYSVKIEDVFESGKSKNANLNDTIYRLIKMIEKNGDSIITDFHIVIDEDGNFAFDVSDNKKLRFLADVYGESYTSNLTEAQIASTPDDIITFLAGKKNFAIGDYEESGNSKTDFIVGKGYTKQELLQMVTIRYAMKLTSFRKYIGTTVATDINDYTVAVIMENSQSLPGVSIVEDTVRRYNDSRYFAHILGYTGKIDSEELTYLNETDKEEGGAGDRYDINDVVGKSGIESHLETTLWVTLR